MVMEEFQDSDYCQELDDDGDDDDAFALISWFILDKAFTSHSTDSSWPLFLSHP